jgi:hypothetical protein
LLRREHGASRQTGGDYACADTPAAVLTGHGVFGMSNPAVDRPVHAHVENSDDVLEAPPDRAPLPSPTARSFATCCRCTTPGNTETMEPVPSIEPRPDAAAPRGDP